MMSIIEKIERNLSLLLGGCNSFDHVSITESKGSTKQRINELKANYGEEIKRIMAQSSAERVEYGVMLCTESTVSPKQFARGEGSVRLGCVTRGAPIAVEVRDCRNNIRPVGTLHTHFETDVFSVDDILVGIRKPEMLTCLAFSRNGITHLACISPWLFNEHPIRTRTWILNALDQTKKYYRKINDLAYEWGHEFKSYIQGRIKFEDMSPAAREAYREYQYCTSMIRILQPAVEKLLDYCELEL